MFRSSPSSYGKPAAPAEALVMAVLRPTPLDSRLRAAEAVGREAGRLAADHFARRELLSIDRKGAQDLVSEADRECEDLIVASLGRLFPRDGFLGEERGFRNPDAEAVWVIDPIDGTHNFLTGIPFWCVSVGLVVQGKLTLGIIYDPMSAELFSAREGGGAFLNGRPIRVSGETDPTRARVCVGFSYRRPVAGHVRAVDALLSNGSEYLRLGSGALGLAYTAAGRFDGYWERHMNSWDAAAGLVLVREAGGWTNDFEADEHLSKGCEILAATPGLVETLKGRVDFGGSE
jgi:myo-inositol-1(or 4)-monophosphatase